MLNLVSNNTTDERLLSGILSMIGFHIRYTCCTTDGTAPMAEFADVFDPAGDPQKAMVGMMQVGIYELSDILTLKPYIASNLLVITNSAPTVSKLC